MLWVWDRPAFQRLRFTISMANLSVRLPAIMALVGTQIGLLATQVGYPQHLNHHGGRTEDPLERMLLSKHQEPMPRMPTPAYFRRRCWSMLDDGFLQHQDRNHIARILKCY